MESNKRVTVFFIALFASPFAIAAVLAICTRQFSVVLAIALGCIGVLLILSLINVAVFAPVLRLLGFVASRKHDEPRKGSWHLLIPDTF